MASDADFLVNLLDLEPIEVNIFRGKNSPADPMPRVFGGQVAAQALMAAGRTVEVGRVHSLHAYFLRPGDPHIPILYEVDRIRDGRSFTTRRVVAIQHGEAIFNLATSFHVDEFGMEHQSPMPDVPPPDTLPNLVARLEPFRESLGDWFTRARPIEQRHIGELPWLHREGREPAQRLWLRTNGALPDDQLLHACAVAYASDMSLVDTMLGPHDIDWGDPDFMGASLDHCMWFHRPFRADEWLLYDIESPTASGARGFARGSLFTQDGRLAVSIVQEGLMRQKNLATRAVQSSPTGPADRTAGS